jgi:hypothetical protein
MSKWMDGVSVTNPGHDTTAAQLALEGVERFLFATAVVDGFECQLSEGQLESLQALVEKYRQLSHAFIRADDPSKARFRAAVRGRETLVVWTAFCFVFEAARRADSCLLDYGQPLDWSKLRHLALGDKLSQDAALAVARYLRSRTCTLGQTVFTLKQQSGTFKLALQYASGCARLKGIWEAEKRDAAARKAAHFSEVLRKQALARECRKDLEYLNRQKNEALADRDRSSTYPYDFSKYRHYDNKHDELIISVRNKERDLEEAERSPPAVLQPLPAAKDLAMQALFFLHMPLLYRVVSCMAFTAQQMLLPRQDCESYCKDWRILQAVAVTPAKSSWPAHYNSAKNVCMYCRSPSAVEAGTDGDVKLASMQTAPKLSDVGPRHVEQISNAEQGIWHPDGLALHMQWSGGASSLDTSVFGGGLINPFAPGVSGVFVTEYYTEQLPSSSVASLQWAMPQHGSDGLGSTRGNEGLANQDTKPAFLSKKEYLTLGVLRAYPNQQLRKLCVALNERSLPFTEPTVHVFIRQLLFHLGDLADQKQPYPLWRTDVLRDADINLKGVLRDELNSLAEELEDMPRDHSAVIILGETAAFLAQWDDECRPVARRFSRMARRWAEEMEAEVVQADFNPELVASLRAKQCKLFMIALLCYANFRLDPEDAAQMCELMVRMFTLLVCRMASPIVKVIVHLVGLF